MNLFRPIKLTNISPQWPTCGSSVDASLGFVPPRLGWPCLDTNFVTMIVSLLGELLNFGHIVLIFLVFFFRTNLLIFDFFPGSSTTNGARNPSCAHGGKLRGLRQCLGRQVCRRQLTPPLGVLASTAGGCLSQRTP